jgi:hypothetical protein
MAARGNYPVCGEGIDLFGSRPIKRAAETDALELGCFTVEYLQDEALAEASWRHATAFPSS